MNTKLTSIITILLIIVSVMAGLLLWKQLPDPMASHWNINDQVDGYMSKFWGVFMMPLVLAGMFLLFLLVPVIDPLKANIAKFRETFNLFIVFIVGFMVYIHALSLLWNLGYTKFGMSKAMLPILGVLFIFIGYLLKQAKRNWFIGIRTPWTLSSDSVWNETHRVGSILFTICGVLAIIGSFFGRVIAFWILSVPLMVSTLFLLVYSYILYQKEANV